MPSPSELDEYKQAQVGLVALASDDLRTLWSGLNVTDGVATKAALMEFMPALTSQYGAVAAMLAADWYDDLRSRENLQSRFAAIMAATLPIEQIREQVGYATSVHLFTESPEGTLVRLLGDLGKDVLQPGWNTIVNSANADPDAAGWHRETRPSRSYASGCGFCQLLEGRGGVYKRTTAPFAAHGSCKCVAYPSWDADAEEVPADAYAASSRYRIGRDHSQAYSYIEDVERTRFAST